jgi:hypothetical protein
MDACRRCGGSIDQRFRFCPWCSAPLRLKLVEFFRSHPLIDADRSKSLRVSRYLGAGSDAHVRFSVWTDLDDGAVAAAAVSLDEAEAARLARFLLDGERPLAPPPSVRRLLDQLRR